VTYNICRHCKNTMPPKEFPLCTQCALDNGVLPSKTYTILPTDWTPPAGVALREAFLKVDVEEKDLMLVLKNLAEEAEKIKGKPFNENLFRSLLDTIKNLKEEVDYLNKGYTRCGLCGCWDRQANHHGDCPICARAQYAD
jgi:hypothetical protein